MKVRRILLGLLLLVTLVVAGVLVLLDQKVLTSATAQLSRAFQRPVRIAGVRWIPPLMLVFERVDVQDVFQARRIEVQMDAHSFAKRKLRLTQMTLEAPVLNVRRLAGGRLVFGGGAEREVDLPGSLVEFLDVMIHSLIPVSTEQWTRSRIGWESSNTPTIERPVSSADRQPLRIGRIAARQGRVNFIQETTDGQWDVSIRNGALMLTEIGYPVEAGRSALRITGHVSSQQLGITDGRLLAEGWIDAAGRDMDVQVRAWGAEKEPVLQATLVARDNALHVEGDAFLRGHVWETLTAWPAAELALGVPLSAEALSGVALRLDFAFDTPMDNLQVEQVRFSGALEEHTPATRPDAGTDVGKVPDRENSFDAGGL